MITLRDVLEGTQGRIHGDVPQDLMFSHVCHDSRQVRPGDLFIAIVGPNFDGHDFVADAKAKGAIAALVSETGLSKATDAGVHLIVVEDTGLALQRLAAYWRTLFDVSVIGVTGSMGKSSVKEVIASVLAQNFSVIRARASYNNEIGMPLTLMEVNPDTEAAVLEFGGAYRFGEITELADIARPTVGVVTNVSHSHLQRMGSLEAIAETKAELPRSLPADGVAILNGDDFRVRAMADESPAPVVFYGLAPDCEVRAKDVESHGLDGISFTLVMDGDEQHLNVPLIGAHSVHTVLAAIAVGRWFGMGLDQMIPGFEDSAIQLRLLTLPGINRSTIIDDTYNANPTSCLAALNLLAELDANRKVAIFGDILELGEFEDEGHRIVGRRSASVVQQLISVGDKARIITDAAIDSGMSQDQVIAFESKDTAIEQLPSLIQPGDFVLVKGSRGVKMEDVVSALRDGSRPA
ncbi:MAG: UDP-N-acetylmuramoyl-tripeptide--D-alanyl-D-alanine ligase [Sphaerobacteraceae bacterium]|nr:MAG: UDP-N-acetylmuramoyl-tripeptide--D-alanyl-D-alanine ligase [Sphaerobacteraceae bacterium]